MNFGYSLTKKDLRAQLKLFDAGFHSGFVWHNNGRVNWLKWTL